MARNSDTPKTKAETAFSHSEQRDRLVMRMIERERAAVDVKTARLKALRLAKEAAEPPRPRARKGRRKPPSGTV